MVTATDRRQARTVFGYVTSQLDTIDQVERTLHARKLLVRRRRDSLDVRGNVSIEIHASSYRTLRGYTVLSAIADEVAFWQSEDAANPDTEVLNALRPAMGNVPNALLLVISTPYAQKGELFKAHERYYGRDDPRVLVWNADTRSMNPTFD